MRKQSVIFAIVTFFAFNFFLPANSSLSQKSSLIITQQKNDILRISWQIPAMEYADNTLSGKSFTKASFNGCSFEKSGDGYEIPIQNFLLGIPNGADVEYEISDIVYERKDNVSLLPFVRIGRDKNGISINEIDSNPSTEKYVPLPVIKISEQDYFRDMPIVRVTFHPIEYDASQKSLKIIKSATLSFRYHGGEQGGASFISRSKLDHLYEKLLLNFEQARNWLIRKPTLLKKTTASLTGPWFRIEVTEEGFYKINSAALNAAGIDVGGIDPRTLRIYNHGGKPLNPNTNSLVEQPEGPVETAIYVSGEADGSFDSNDYILFYGSGAGGWYYSPASNDFRHSQHAYDTKNYYLLTYGSLQGKRMQEVSTPTGGASVTEQYYLERLHYEEDKHNLLASGADWYGYNFFGRSQNVSLNYSLDNLSSTSRQSKMRIKFKGGSGLVYLDNDFYRYYFSVWLNPTKAPSSLITNQSLSEEKSVTVERNFSSGDYLVNGTNSVYIEYTANFEKSHAYLDWIEFYYPRDFSALNNQLGFYTNTVGQIVNYTINGFSQTDIKLFDVTDPVNVNLLQTQANVSNGSLSFNLDLSDGGNRRVFVTSLTSSEITNISSLRSYQPDKNLMDPSHFADFIVITHPSFISYAEEVVELRQNSTDPLKGIVVNKDDIYFYFSSSVKDMVAIRNFIRYAYYNWSSPQPAYVLLFGDGHYDYRNISLPDTNWVPPFEISANLELDSRESDNFYVDLNFTSNTFGSIRPDLAIGRLPAESYIDARRIVDKLNAYENEKRKDGWQTSLTFVADDEVTSRSDNEWGHQRDTENMSNISVLNKFIKKKIYLSAYESVPGGFGRVKPAANQAIIDQLNEGTLLINYVGHGSPTAWAHESALDMTRDLNRIQNEYRLPLWIAATCDFGKYDDPTDPSFTEALIWQENKGAIAVISSSRLVYSSLNTRFNSAYLTNLFPSGNPSSRLGDAMLLATGSGENDQKYHLFGDPTMYLADPRNSVQLTSIAPDTLKALSKVTVQGQVSIQAGEQILEDFSGGAVMIINDARYDSVNTGGPGYYTLLGSRIFKGEVSVSGGIFNGEFIVPKSIRYQNVKSGRITVYAWDDDSKREAIGYVDTLLFTGSSGGSSDFDGPEILINFEGQDDFREGDLVGKNPVLVAEIIDLNGINLTREVGHTIEIQIDERPEKDITSFFAYDRNSYSEGELLYHLEDLDPGEHKLKLQAWDNLNNPSVVETGFRVVESEGLVLKDVVNYPNPFSDKTNFTFQVHGTNLSAGVRIKIYTITGRLVRSMDNLIPPSDGFNYYPWDGRDDDGDIIANGVYLYKIIIKSENEQKEAIEKLVILK